MKSWFFSEYYLDFASLFIGSPQSPIVAVKQLESLHEASSGAFSTDSANLDLAQKVHF